jgi:hypothetical protein
MLCCTLQEFQLEGLSQVVRILQFQERTLASFRKNPTALATIVNMALYNNTVTLHLDKVSVLHDEATSAIVWRWTLRCLPRGCAACRQRSSTTRLRLGPRRIPS